ncbi:MAG: hypothetical protein U0263_23955, partial [Polyangiaceae bacterium]
VTTCEPGSVFIEFVVTTTAILGFIPLMFRAAQKLASEQNRQMIEEERAKSMGINNEALKGLQVAHAEVLKALVTEVVAKVMNGHKEDHETANLLRSTLVDLSKLLRDGVRLQLSAKAPDAVQGNMPENGGAPLLLDAVKQLLASNPGDRRP